MARSGEAQVALAAALMEATVRGGASRQVAAAVAAAMFRSVSVTGCTVVDELVNDRLDMLAPCLRAQVTAGLQSGQDVHTARGLVEPDVVLRGNVARHAGFDSGQPLGDVPAAHLKRLQRGGQEKAGKSGATQWKQRSRRRTREQDVVSGSPTSHSELQAEAGSIVGSIDSVATGDETKSFHELKYVPPFPIPGFVLEDMSVPSSDVSLPMVDSHPGQVCDLVEAEPSVTEISYGGASGPYDDEQDSLAVVPYECDLVETDSRPSYSDEFVGEELLAMPVTVQPCTVSDSIPVIPLDCHEQAADVSPDTLSAGLHGTSGCTKLRSDLMFPEVPVFPIPVADDTGAGAACITQSASSGVLTIWTLCEGVKTGIRGDAIGIPLCTLKQIVADISAELRELAPLELVFDFDPDSRRLEVQLVGERLSRWEGLQVSDLSDAITLQYGDEGSFVETYFWCLGSTPQGVSCATVPKKNLSKNNRRRGPPRALRSQSSGHRR